MKKKNQKCKLILDHQPVWNGNQFVCANCGIEFVPKEAILKELYKRIGEVIDRMKISNVATINIDENGNCEENLRAVGREEGYEQCKKEIKQALCKENNS